MVIFMYGGAPPQEGGGGGMDLATLAAMEAMAEQERRQRYVKYAEGLLPLVLLVILGVFIAYKMGLISLGMIGFNKSLNVLILTDDPNAPQIMKLQNILQTQVGGYMGVSATATTTRLDPEFPVSTAQLAQYDVVILYQVHDKTLSLSQRDEISKYLAHGGRMIIVMDSGTCIPSSEVANTSITGTSSNTGVVCTGWGGGVQYDLGKYIPVECLSQYSSGQFCAPKDVYNVRLRFIDPNDPLNPNPGNPYYPSVSARISKMTVLSGIRVKDIGRTVAKVQVMQGNNVKETYYGIVAAEGLLGTKVLYFNYDPTITPAILYKALAWLT